MDKVEGAKWLLAQPEKEIPPTFDEPMTGEGDVEIELILICEGRRKFESLEPV